MKAFVNKVETLSDQSVKLSLYVTKEFAQSAFSFAYKEVSIKEFEAADTNKDSAIHLACQSIDKIKEMLITELVESVKPEEVKE